MIVGVSVAECEGTAVEVLVAVAVGVELAALSANAILTHPPLFIDATSGATIPEEGRGFAASAAPKFEFAAYCLSERVCRSTGIVKPLFSVPNRPT